MRHETQKVCSSCFTKTEKLSTEQNNCFEFVLGPLGLNLNPDSLKKESDLIFGQSIGRIKKIHEQISRTHLRRSLQQSQSNSGTLGQWERSPFTRVFRPENNKINISFYYFLPITFIAKKTFKDTGASKYGPIKQKQK